VNSKGFTLIELMIVIAIVVIIVAAIGQRVKNRHNKNTSVSEKYQVRDQSSKTASNPVIPSVSDKKFIYIKDARTGLCFAQIYSDSLTYSYVVVPCEKVQNYLK